MLPIRSRVIPRVALLGAVASLVAVSSCERGAKVPSGATTTVATPAIAPESTTTGSAAWDPSFGAGLLVPAGTPMIALGVSPDTETLGLEGGTSVTLVSRAGAAASSTIGAAADEADGCSGLPAWHLAGAALRPWNVGFIGADVQPLALDSIASLSRADSTRLAATATRMASALPAAGFERFVGLPFVTEALWRLRLTTAPTTPVEVVVASLVRRLNIEAQPLQERTFVVFEQPPGADAVLAHTERAQGSEEKVETRDVLGAVRLGASGQVMLVVSHDFGDAIAYSLLERDTAGSWRVRWTSHRASC